MITSYHGVSTTQCNVPLTTSVLRGFSITITKGDRATTSWVRHSLDCRKISEILNQEEYWSSSLRQQNKLLQLEVSHFKHMATTFIETPP